MHISYEQNKSIETFDYRSSVYRRSLPPNTGQIMPYYGIPVDQTDENVAFGFNKQIITTLLRDSLKFKGVICTDWNIINYGNGRCSSVGCRKLEPKERVLKVLDAGCDQFGGESSPSQIIELVKEGKLSEARIDRSVKRLLRDKFTLGLFGSYVDEEKALGIATTKEKQKLAELAQAKSTVLLKMNLYCLWQKTQKSF